MIVFAAFAPIIFFAIGFIIYLIVSEKRAKKTPYQVVAEGKFDHAEYTAEGGRYGRTVTVIYFHDGTTCLIKGFHDILVRRGETIKISKNEWDYKIEKG